MTKSERLLFIISYLQNRGRSTVDELASECGVSHRTIYRDINSLSILNFPIIQNNGYRLIRKSHLATAGLNDSDVELLCYALKSNGLSKHAFFRRRFRVIENMILDTVRSTRTRKSPRLFYWPDDINKLIDGPNNKFVEDFVKAIKRYRLVDIVINVKPKERLLRSIPLAIQLEQGKTKLVFIPSGDSKPRAVWTNSILKIRELPGAFDPQELVKFRLSEIKDK